MAFSFTSIAYLFGSLVAPFLIYRLYQNSQREKTIVAKIFFYFCLLFYFYILVTAIGTLFFVNNSEILRGVVIISTFFQALAAASFGYLLVRLKFPRILPWVGFGLVFILGIIAMINSIITPFYPFLDKTGAIDWDYPPLSKTLRGFSFLITLIPMIIIFFQQAISSSDPKIKRKAYLFSLLFLATLIAIVVSFFIRDRLHLGAVSEDAAALVAFFFISVLVFLSPHSSSS